MLQFDLEAEDIFFNTQCFIENQIINENVATSLNKIADGAQFAFYNLSLSEEERQVLSNIEILEFDNVVINVDSLSSSFIQDIYQHITNMNVMLVDEDDEWNLLNIIMSITNAIIGQTATKKFELALRTRENYIEKNDCIFWHLDKTKQEVLGQQNTNKELRFIIPLKGSGTIYQNINITTRSKFLETSEEAPYYYGHGLDGCVNNDAILNLLNSSKTYKPEPNFGSVHVAGRNGAMHAAPEMSGNRFLLLVTTFFE